MFNIAKYSYFTKIYIYIYIYIYMYVYIPMHVLFVNINAAKEADE